MDDQRTEILHRRVNKWAARLIPALLVGAVGYATWVVVVLLAGMICSLTPQALAYRVLAHSFSRPLTSY